MHTFDTAWPDGLAVSTRGEAWAALTASDRLEVIDAGGRRVGAIGLPAGSLPTNIGIGGNGGNELFVTAAHSQSLLRILLDGELPGTQRFGRGEHHRHRLQPADEVSGPQRQWIF